MDAKAPPPPPPPPVRAATSKPPPPLPARANPSQRPPPVAPAAAKSVAPPPPPPAALHVAPAPPAAAAEVGPPPQVTLQRQMRVSVKASVRDPNLIVARPLADGQQLPAGTREALLVIVDNPNDPLVGPPVAGAAGAE